MAEFASSLAAMIGSSIGSDPEAVLRVVDKTGLGGGYTFRLEYSCARCVMQSQADTAPRSEDPLGIPDVFGVLEKQLGLKLERIQSVPVEFIVVDSALKAPTPD